MPLRTRPLFSVVLALMAMVVLPAAAGEGEGPVFAQDMRIGDSVDPTVASVQISQSVWPDFAVDALVIGRNDVFADNLGGSGLAGAVDGPLLLTDGGRDAALRPEIDAEINRVLAPNSGDCSKAPIDIYLLGGTNAVSTATEQAIQNQGWCVMRLAGPSRVETSVAVANAVELLTGSTAEILIARADNFADSAAAAALAARFDLGIVLTGQDSLHPAVSEFMFDARLDTAQEYYQSVSLLGGPAALSQQVEDDIFNGCPCEQAIIRLAGSDRAGTSVAIASTFLARSGGATVMLANGYTDDGWVYALAGGTAGQNFDAPLVYVLTDLIPQQVQDFLQTERPGQLVTVGPDTQVSEATRNEANGHANGAFQN